MLLLRKYTCTVILHSVKGVVQYMVIEISVVETIHKKIGMKLQYWRFIAGIGVLEIVASKFIIFVR